MPKSEKQSHFDFDLEDIEAAPLMALGLDGHSKIFHNEHACATKQIWQNGKYYFQERPKSVQYVLLGACAMCLWVLFFKEIVGTGHSNDQA
jgi:hypothetical protein|eukprot:scaffold2111_cov267-Chaetoceros_neogracile.AAC.3